MEKTIPPLETSVLVLTPELNSANQSNTGVHLLQVWQQVTAQRITGNSQSRGCNIPSSGVHSLLPRSHRISMEAVRIKDHCPLLQFSWQMRGKASGAVPPVHTSIVTRAVFQIAKLHLKTLNCLSPDAHRNSFLWEPEHNSLLLFIHHQLTHFFSKESLYLKSVLWSIFPLCFLTIMISPTNFCLTSFNKPFLLPRVSWILSCQGHLLWSSFSLNSPLWNGWPYLHIMI